MTCRDLPIGLAAAGALLLLGLAANAGTVVMTLNVDSDAGTMGTQPSTLDATLDMIDEEASTTDVSGSLVVRLTISSGVSGDYVSTFQALGGNLSLTGATYNLEPPITVCLGTGGASDLCDPSIGTPWCFDPTVPSGTDGYSKVYSYFTGVSLVPGGAELAAVEEIATPGKSTFKLFDLSDPDLEDNFSLLADGGSFFATGCAANEIVFEDHPFSSTNRSFWGFAGDATATYDTSGADPTVVATLPMDLYLLVIGWGVSSSTNYGVLHLEGDLRAVPEPGVVCLFAAGVFALWCLEGRARLGGRPASSAALRSCASWDRRRS